MKWIVSSGMYLYWKNQYLKRASGDDLLVSNGIGAIGGGSHGVSALMSTTIENEVKKTKKRMK